MTKEKSTPKTIFELRTENDQITAEIMKHPLRHPFRYLDLIFNGDPSYKANRHGERLSPFRPSHDGFRFTNLFPLSKKGAYGLCGGVVAAALDFKLAGRAIPQVDQPPEIGTPLHNYLLGRQLDSLIQGTQILRLIDWIIRSDREIQTFTAGELKETVRRLSKEEFVPLGLVYQQDRFRDKIAIWHDHQVLATSHQTDSDNRLAIKLYDPNFPANDQVFIQVEPTDGGLVCRQWIIDGERRGYFPIRGLLVMPYRQHKPPATLRSGIKGVSR